MNDLHIARTVDPLRDRISRRKALHRAGTAAVALAGAAHLPRSSVSASQQ
jgi:hypothetical protein